MRVKDTESGRRMDEKTFAIEKLRKQAELIAERCEANREELSFLTASLVSVLGELRAWQLLPDNKQNL